MGTKFVGDETEKRVLDAFIKLIRAGNSVLLHCNSVIVRNGLTESQFGVLEALYHLGPLSQKQISEKLLKSGGNITMVIDNLVKSGLVSRQKREDDRRFYWINLTEKGSALIAAIFPEHVKLISRRMNVLTAEEQIELSRLCRKLGLADQKN
jgi:MarR family 2-MHQ and catechol resistance regulon transcriptional repressor